MAEIGKLEWLVDVKKAAEAKRGAQETAEAVEGVEESAAGADSRLGGLTGVLNTAATVMLAFGGSSKMVRAALLALDGNISSLLVRMTGLTGVVRQLRAAKGLVIKASGMLTKAFGFARNAAALFTMSLRSLVVALNAVAVRGILALSSILAGTFATGLAGAAAKLGSLKALLTGFASWMAAGSAGALAFAGAIGGLIGLAGVFLLEWTGVLDFIQGLGEMLGSGLPGWARDGIMALTSILLGGIAAIGAGIVGFVRGTLDGGLVAGFEQAWANIKEVLGIFGGAWKRTFGRIGDAVWAAKDAVANAVGALVGAVMGPFRSMKRRLVGNSIVPETFGAIPQIIRNLLPGAGEAAKMLAGAILAPFTGLRDRVAGAVGGAMDAAASKIRGARGKLEGAASYAAGGVKGGLGKAKDLAGSGKAAGKSFAGGMKDKAGDVGDAAGDMAEEGRKYMPFSPAKVGPLSDLDKVGDGFAGTVADSIRSARGKVGDAASDVAASAAGGAEDMSSAASQPDSGGSGPTTVVEKTVLRIEQQNIEVGDQSIDLSRLTRAELERLADLISDKQGDELRRLSGV